MTEPQLPDIPRTSSGATVLTVGTDLVHVPGFSAQLDQPGTVFAQRTFTAREFREARRRSQERGSSPAQHLAARWAAKESFIKAWSQAHVLRARSRGTSTSPVILAEDVDWREIEVVTDRWGRPSLRLSGTVAHAVEHSLGEEVSTPGCWPVSLSHDGDYAAAIVLHVR
ncbi:holo-ACP synthase AcpS [Actinomyces sp. oral taxon 171]|uniref:holo-ACP synthase AcpS n=1 Tax=Actinomyces sp. oral taxon 171 TaxID=706438 RepID=UPI0001F62809|nr:holo-ACP synthase [Actinomyces sp. oral taxon 171]EFW26127.1 phosphopantetheine--protein transferase domain protein [Actinomyces sp. oral taxon 171 str. F0337]QCT33208.1 holo-ACP synthase [Actinomyces sp. oral taxon 171 str. F0337]